LKVLIVTLGYDEKFIVRALVRHSITENDEIIVLTSKPRDEKVNRALRSLQDLTEKLLKYRPNIRILEVEVEEWPKAVAEIRNEIKRALDKTQNIIINLSGGMRALIMEALIATLQSLRHLSELEIENELENFKGVVRIPIEIFLEEPIKGGELELLRAIQELGNRATLTNLAMHLRRPKSTVHQRLKRLEERGLITTIMVGRTKRIRLTKKAECWLY